MQEKIKQLIEISRKYGSNTRYVIAGGGNTSCKNDQHLWVKASGHALAAITEDGFAVLERKKLSVISEKQYSPNPDQREEEVKEDLNAACITKNRRPSVETSLHNVINYAFVVHLHPTGVNGLMCSQHAETVTNRLFGEKALYIPYADPGYVLYKKVESQINVYAMKTGRHPSIVLIQNHGIFVCADSTNEIESIYNEVISAIEGQMAVKQKVQDVDFDFCIREIIPAIRMMLSREGDFKTLKVRQNERIHKFASSKTQFDKIAIPFTPDVIVYCKSKYLYLSANSTEELLKKAQEEIETFLMKNGYAPKIILIKGIGLVSVGSHAAECDTILDVFEDMMKVAEIAQSFGGEHPMNQAQIDFVDNWEVENYRRKISAGSSTGRVQNKTIIVTGGAQGFGKGIAACLLKEGANVVVADLNEDAGKTTVGQFRELCKSNRTIFVKTNVTEIDSICNLLNETVRNFGGLDVFISNAGILRAGGIEELTLEDFDMVTKINYNAYFYSTRAASKIMKLQNAYAPDNYGDIIQINSKSGLRGSKANYAYAGSKFGGIGLTQSFALELAPFRIKVNSVCPGNYYEGPLWSNPENGLFIQYLQTGKVPGAKTIDDVRKFYMNQVPMGKGTSPEDVTKAIIYLIDQTCETGQALPVTGGQVMIN